MSSNYKLKQNVSSQDGSRKKETKSASDLSEHDIQI